MTSALALRLRFLRSATATVLTLAGACGSAVAQPPAAAGADPAAAILAAHRKIDDEYRRASMSPFTAVAVQYFEPGQTHRLGVSANEAVFDPAETMTSVIEMTLEAGSFVMSPVAGPRASIVLGKNAEGDVAVSPGTPLKARTTIGSRDVVGLGRYFVESFPLFDLIR